MSVFGRNLYSIPAAENNFGNFGSLVRFIDDWDRTVNSPSQQQQQPSRNGVSQQGHQRQPRQLGPAFVPKFDLKETEDNFELHGELPGIAKQNVHVEFTDPQTIVVRGRVARSYTSGTPPAGLALEDVKDEKTDSEMSGAIGDEPVMVSGTDHHEQEQEQAHDNTDSHHARKSSYQATVQDENDDSSITTAEQSTPSTTTTEVAKPESSSPAKTQVQKSSAPPKPQAKYWVAERTVGEFARTFAFPSRVDHEGVSASLDNGILSVIVPKAKKHETRRIAIN
ncbi:Uu.00g042790.m01.CDS01 [Anthostomella pinea]|uniref:Uu.00g042790.m01.CDS01 n=1 Tax=Anthostomella pinea TaxID=933095 RepID=A0AAI8VAN5_9PEZI|nr:Uu.00g042790.m01.CDS01 [Anthostomella pinea]